MIIALYQPDIAANAAAAIRLAACFAVPLQIIEPCGFVWHPGRLRRVGLDYVDRADMIRWPSWSAFDQARRGAGRRLILLTTAAQRGHHRVDYRPDDIILGGRESAGVPEAVHQAADLRVRIPIAAPCRSLNLVTALAVVLGEALRQTGRFPSDGRDG